MKAVRCHNHEICVHEVPEPAGLGVRVRVASAGICGSDLHMLQQGFPIPFTLGHEIAGVTDNGIPVAIEPSVYCGHCERCVRGDYNLCVRGTETIMGVGRDGGMTEHLVVPEHCLVPLPGGIRAEDACLVEPLSVAVRGIAKAGITDKHKVAIIGGGSIGLCAVAVARQATEWVHLFARHPAQLRAGEILGATLGDASTDTSENYDLVIDCAGTDAALEQAANLCRHGGTVLMLATYWEGLTFPAMQMTMKELRTVTSMAQGRQGLVRDVDIAAATLAKNPLIAPTLITHRLPLEAAAEAFDIAADRKQGAIKVAFNP
ncbi:alcohol dehydrogenase catalytic domain-containing protein [Parahaliea maris]|uniref:Alcohol dehydrogenase catalytic domain-containing protein n=1 Tax=Parahaliea maris TaxID=2716870 RepID=A0A5C8ZU97_9GAMM|nr:alcohol dehydrogenase catalytic domain-containing protein [Parahaliea maris]TXS91379.1 alcohol dehydrogenase catalytic domain-containing protein [Parahaliea maris]